jgi:hypothetical protein
MFLPALRIFPVTAMPPMLRTHTEGTIVRSRNVQNVAVAEVGQHWAVPQGGLVQSVPRCCLAQSLPRCYLAQSVPRCCLVQSLPRCCLAQLEAFWAELLCRLAWLQILGAFCPFSGMVKMVEPCGGLPSRRTASSGVTSDFTAVCMSVCPSLQLVFFCLLSRNSVQEKVLNAWWNVSGLL